MEAEPEQPSATPSASVCERLPPPCVPEPVPYSATGSDDSGSGLRAGAGRSQAAAERKAKGEAARNVKEAEAQA